MKKKEAFWIIITIITIITIIVGAGVTYLNISKYSALQNEFANEIKVSVEKLSDALSKNELPKETWVKESESINNEIETTFKTFLENRIETFGAKNNIKHADFFESLKIKNGYLGDYQLIDVTNANIGNISYEFFKWLDNLPKEGETHSIFGKWYSELKKNYFSGWHEEYSPDKILESLHNPFDINTDFIQYFTKGIYTNLFALIMKIADISAEKEKKEEMLKQFQRDYNTLLPSLLLTKHLIDNIPEFKAVKLESIYVSSYNPVDMSKIKVFIPPDKTINWSYQPTLCFCYGVSSAKTDKTSQRAKGVFNCNPHDKTKSLLFNIPSRMLEIRGGPAEGTEEKIDKDILDLSIKGIQYNVYPNELGTTIPILFTFKSNYESFYNLLRALHRINGGENNKNIFDLGEKSPKLPIPVTVSKISFKMNENILSDNFEFRRQMEQFPNNSGDANWNVFLEEQKKQRIQKLEDNIKNEYFIFLTEVLIFLYDPEGFKECWDNITSFASATFQTTPVLK